jgi:PTH1 family peptidyl-tRNA hydrolase
MIFSRNKPYLIVGLGNPGREYRASRHNVGFLVLDHLAEKLGTSFSRVKMNALMAAVRYHDQRLVLIKPQTYMNLSGKAVSSYLRFYKIPLDNLLVVCDDVDLPFETLRLRAEGGDAGQKGVRSIIENLGTQRFPRLRVGVDRPPGRMETSDYVLQDFTGAQNEILPLVLEKAAEAALTFVETGLNQAMTTYNQSPSP